MGNSRRGAILKTLPNSPCGISTRSAHAICWGRVQWALKYQFCAPNIGPPWKWRFEVKVQRWHLKLEKMILTPWKKKKVRGYDEKRKGKSHQSRWKLKRKKEDVESLKENPIGRAETDLQHPFFIPLGVSSAVATQSLLLMLPRSSEVRTERLPI